MKNVSKKSTLINFIFLFLYIVIILGSYFIVYNVGKYHREAKNNFFNYQQENGIDEEYYQLKNLVEETKIDMFYNQLVTVAIVIFILLIVLIVFKFLSFKFTNLEETKDEFKIEIIVVTFLHLFMVAIILFIVLAFSKEQVARHNYIINMVLAFTGAFLILSKDFIIKFIKNKKLKGQQVSTIQNEDL